MKMGQMKSLGQQSVSKDACLVAAEHLRLHLVGLVNKIAALVEKKVENGEVNPSQFPLVRPDNPLPVDHFLAEMADRKNAPRLVSIPNQLGNAFWTNNLSVYIYSGIEQAFTKAGLLPGGNRSGHVAELRKLESWVAEQALDPSRAVPKYFVQRAAQLFSKGILEERRPERIDVLYNIAHGPISKPEDLAHLQKWIEEDLDDSRLRMKGRPPEYQRITFAIEIASLWNVLTGEPITRGPDTNFARFLRACWKSGFCDTDVEVNFKRVLRHHIGEADVPKACGGCEACKKSAKCERKIYFGILM